MYMYMYMYTNICVYVCMYVCMYVYMYMYIFTCMFNKRIVPRHGSIHMQTCAHTHTNTVNTQLILSLSVLDQSCITYNGFIWIYIVSKAKVNQTYFKHRTMAHQEGSLEALATWHQPTWKKIYRLPEACASSGRCVVLDKLIWNCLFDPARYRRSWRTGKWKLITLPLLGFKCFGFHPRPQPVLSLPLS